MRKIPKISLVLPMFLLLSSVFCSDITELSEKVFVETINRYNFSFILFYSTFCAHTNEIVSNFSEVSNTYYKNSEKINFFKVNIQKSASLAKNLAVRGYPTIKVFDRNSQTFSDWELDFTKPELKYLIDSLLFGSVPHYKTVDKIRADKSKFQLFFIGNISENSELTQIFRLFAGRHEFLLYNFAVVENTPAILNYFFIPEEEARNSSFVLLRRKYDNFDKRFRVTAENQHDFKVNFEEFFKNYSHPIYIGHFNHRVRKFLIEQSIISIGIFYRKKTKVYDSFILGLFKNMTRTYILDLKQQNNEENYIEMLKNNQKIVFTFLDLEDMMVRRLAFFMGFEEKDLPIVAAFEISKKHRRVFTKFLAHFLQEYSFKQIYMMIAGIFHENNKISSFPSTFKSQIKPTDSKVYDIDPALIKNFLKFYHPKYNKTLHIVEYSASFCLHCKKISVLIDKFSKSEGLFGDIYIYFGRIQLYGSEISSLNIEKVPVLRLFFDLERYVDINLESFSEKNVIENIKKNIQGEEEKNNEINKKIEL